MAEEYLKSYAYYYGQMVGVMNMAEYLTKDKIVGYMKDIDAEKKEYLPYYGKKLSSYKTREVQK